MNKKFLIKILILSIGFIISSLGTSIFLGSNLGADAVTVMLQGLANFFGTTVGKMSSIFSAIAIVIIFFIDRPLIKTGSIVAIFVFGPFIDIWNFIFSNFYQSVSEVLLIRVIMVMLATFIMCIGIAIVFSSSLGSSIIDVIPVVIATKYLLDVEYRYILLAWNVLYLIIGVLLGGVFGLGTILCAALSGPILQVLVPKFSKVVHGHI